MQWWRVLIVAANKNTHTDTARLGSLGCESQRSWTLDPSQRLVAIWHIPAILCCVCVCGGTGGRGVLQVSTCMCVCVRMDVSLNDHFSCQPLATFTERTRTCVSQQHDAIASNADVRLPAQLCDQVGAYAMSRPGQQLRRVSLANTFLLVTPWPHVWKLRNAWIVSRVRIGTLVQCSGNFVFQISRLPYVVWCTCCISIINEALKIFLIWTWITLQLILKDKLLIIIG